ncbi:hypothetical protein ABIF63_006012 [Bradyrhizobium japonicum]|uniref:Uncharacterized protein n=1 Tax=Bradyrhizobium japonicum TaxID=375 RepID=A0ABV2RY90_BRAJP
MNIHYNVTTEEIMSYGCGADHGDGFEDSHFPGCKVAIIPDQPIDARTQRFDVATWKVVDKDVPDAEPDPLPKIKAAVRQELIDTDYLLLPHAPISEADLPAWIAYRKALRESSKGRTTPAEMLAVIPARPDGADVFEWLRARFSAPGV